MKDRWKLFWICVAIATILAIVIGALTGSFKKVQLTEYGILQYMTYPKTIVQTARSNGNYLVGLDYGFIKFPRGIILIQFNTSALTKDMSMVQIQGHFTGRLILSEVMTMYEDYGTEYLQFLKASVEQYTRQALQEYSLSDLISNRAAVQNNVKGVVCLQVQSDYSWVQCDYVSLGQVGANIPEPQILEIQKSYEELQISLYERNIKTQKKVNFYRSGGAALLKSLSELNSKLFLNVTGLMVELASTRISNTTLLQSASRYYLMDSTFPAVNNTITFKI